MFSVVFRQQKILYHPPDKSIEDVRGEAEILGFRGWPGEGEITERFRALIKSSERENPRGTVLVFHGNAGWAGDRGVYAEALESLGWRVLLVEYPGYAGRSGHLGEKSLVQDAIVTLRMAHDSFGPPLYLWGESLGSGVAAAVAANVPELVDGIAMHTPWSRLSDLASHYYPWLPVKLFLRDHYDNIANLGHFDGPVAVLLCEGDSIVPMRFGEKLYENLSGPKRKWVFPGVDHNEWPALPGLPWWDEVMRFLSSGKP